MTTALEAARLVKTYSGGMARKLDVALGMMHRPRVLFLDEPTTGLDPEARAEMWTEIVRMAAEESMTVLLTTHYLGEADRLAARLAIVDHGRVVADGTPEELKSELRGDTITVELAEPDERARAALAHLDGLREVAVDGTTVRGRAEEPGHPGRARLVSGPARYRAAGRLHVAGHHRGQPGPVAQ
jgi:ABC-2 type transport system ATP-binding protein